MSGGVSGAIPGRAMRRVCSVPSRAQSPAYSTGISPSRGSLRASPGSAYGSPIVTEPKPLPSIFSSSTLPNSQRASSPFSAQRNSPSTLRRMGSGTSRTTSPYSARLGSPLSVAVEEGQAASGSSPVRTGMTAMPQHYGSTLPRTLLHEGADPYSTHSYELYERMVPRPDSLTGVSVYLYYSPVCGHVSCVVSSSSSSSQGFQSCDAYYRFIHSMPYVLAAGIKGYFKTFNRFLIASATF